MAMIELAGVERRTVALGRIFRKIIKSWWKNNRMRKKQNLFAFLYLVCPGSQLTVVRAMHFYKFLMLPNTLLMKVIIKCGITCYIAYQSWTSLTRTKLDLPLQQVLCSLIRVKNYHNCSHWISVIGLVPCLLSASTQEQAEYGTVQTCPPFAEKKCSMSRFEVRFLGNDHIANFKMRYI